MQRAALEHQNALASDTTGIVLQSLAEGVAKGISEEQQRVQKQRDAERQSKAAIDMYTKMSGTNAGSSGDLIPEIRISSDGSAKTVIRTASPTEIKSRIDVEKADKKAKAIDGYISGNISDVDLLKNMGNLGLSDSEFEVATQARKKLRSSSIEADVNNEMEVKRVLSQQSSGIPDGFKPVYSVDKFGNMSISKLEPESASDIKSKRELQESQKLAEIQNKKVVDGAKDTIDTIAEIKNGIDNFGIWGALPSIPGDKRVNWEANVDKLLSRRIVDLMSEMKNASKTGATGFGQLSEKELKVLQDASTALKRTMNKSDALKYLNQMEAIASKVLANENIPAFNSEEEANAANLPVGSIIMINGRKARVK